MEVLKSQQFERDVDTQNYAWFDQRGLVFDKSSRDLIKLDDLNVLNDKTKILSLIRLFESSQLRRLQLLDAYYNGDNVGVLEDSRRVDKSVIDNRASHNWAKLITDFHASWSTANAIRYISDDENTENNVRIINNQNEIDTQDQNALTDMLKFGWAFELVHRSQWDQDETILLSPLNTFAIYSTDINPRLTAVIHYDKTSDGKIQLMVWTDTQYLTWTLSDKGTVNDKHVESHSFGRVPVTHWWTGRERLGIFENVLLLINLYDSAVSDTANFMSDLSNAMLVVAGDFKNGDYNKAQIDAMVKARALLLQSGLSADGDQTTLDAKYIHPEFDATGVQGYKNDLKQAIFQLTSTPDLSNEDFATPQSGKAMEYKMQQASTTHQKSFVKGLKHRYKLISAIERSVNGLMIDVDSLSFQFTPNLPKFDDDRLATAQKFGMELSQETLHEYVGFDPDIEAQRLEEQAEHQSDAVTAQGDTGFDNTKGDV
jgi:SPP1 family phage portal protein